MLRHRGGNHLGVRPGAEWAETELKAARLLALASAPDEGPDEGLDDGTAEEAR